MATIPRSGLFHVDAKSESLFRGAEPVALGRRAVAVLRLLLERAGEPVSRQTLIEAAWPRLAIEDSNLSVQIAAVRRVLAEQAGGANWIETLPRRGYRYVGRPIPIVNGVVRSSSPTSDERPSMAVLPFTSMGGGSRHERFTDGIVEDVIMALSRFKSLFVIARNSSFEYKGRTINIKQVGWELGVRYVVEGGVRKTGEKLRVSVQLVDAESGYQLWSERYDRELEDVFDVQDEIVRAIVSVLPGRMEGAGRDIAVRKPTSNMTAYDLVLLGNEQWRRLEKSALAQARTISRRSDARSELCTRPCQHRLDDRLRGLSRGI